MSDASVCKPSRCSSVDVKPSLGKSVVIASLASPRTNKKCSLGAVRPVGHCDVIAACNRLLEARKALSYQPSYKPVRPACFQNKSAGHELASALQQRMTQETFISADRPVATSTPLQDSSPPPVMNCPLSPIRLASDQEDSDITESENEEVILLDVAFNSDSNYSDSALLHMKTSLSCVTPRRSKVSDAEEHVVNRVVTKRRHEVCVISSSSDSEGESPVMQRHSCFARNTRARLSQF